MYEYNTLQPKPNVLQLIGSQNAQDVNLDPNLRSQ